MPPLKKTQQPRRVVMVTFGTDGFVDYVQVPDGQRYMLGPISVLKLITGLVPTRTARVALKEFVSSHQVMLSVDLDRMWAMLPFRRARFSSTTNPLMQGHDRQAQIARYSESEKQTAMLKTASYDTFTANVELAEDIVAKVAATDEAIERLKTAGKRFDSVRAKQDLHKIASRVAEIAQNVDLAQPWVGNDLADLSKQATEIHGLFEV
jgi:hypothetical protein